MRKIIQSSPPVGSSGPAPSQQYLHPKMARSTAPAPSPDADNTVRPRPSWDTSPNTFPQYYMDLLRWLPYQGAKYATIVAYYYVLHRGQVCCVSTNHAARAAAKTIVKGTFAAPVHVLSTTIVLVPPMSPPPIAPPPPTPPSAGSSAAPAAEPPPTPATTVTSSQSRYVENYEVVEECVSEFYTLIAETVDDE